MRFLLLGLALLPATHTLPATAEPTLEETEAVHFATVNSEASGSLLAADDHKDAEFPGISIGLRELPDRMDLQFVLNEDKDQENHSQSIRVEVPDSVLDSIGESPALVDLVENVSGALWHSLGSFETILQLINGQVSDNLQTAPRLSPKEIDASEPDMFEVLVAAMDQQLFGATQQAQAHTEAIIDADAPDEVGTLATAINQMIGSSDLMHNHENSREQIKRKTPALSTSPINIGGDQWMPMLLNVVEGMQAFPHFGSEAAATEAVKAALPLDVWSFLDQSIAEAMPTFFRMFGQPMEELFEFLQSTISSESLLQMPEVRWSSSLEKREETGTQNTADACTLIINAERLHTPAHINVEMKGPYVLIQTKGSFDQNHSADESENQKGALTFSVLTTDSDSQENLGSKLRGARVSSTSSLQILVPSHCAVEHPRTHVEEQAKWAALIFPCTGALDETHTDSTTSSHTHTHTFTSQLQHPVGHEAQQMHYLQHNAIHAQQLGSQSNHHPNHNINHQHMHEKHHAQMHSRAAPKIENEVDAVKMPTAPVEL